MRRINSALARKSGDKTRPSYLLLLIIILVLSLLTWTFFYYKSMPLSAQDTTVVVGIWFLVVFSVKIAGQRFRDHMSKKGHKR